MPTDRFSRFSRKSEPTEPGPPKPLVLVVDDDFNIRNALKFTLQKNYRVRLCTDGELLKPE